MYREEPSVGDDDVNAAEKMTQKQTVGSDFTEFVVNVQSCLSGLFQSTPWIHEELV